MLLHDEPPTTQDLVSNKFRLQLEAMQQITQGLDEGRDMEYERDRVICEACETREAVDQRQEPLAQFRLFQEFLATQALAGRLLDDPSDNTWQAIHPPPSSNALDSGAQQAMRVSTDCISTKPSITDTNCPVCRNSPGVPGHTLQQCPVIMQLGLRLPDTTPPSSISIISSSNGISTCFSIDYTNEITRGYQ